MKDRNMVALAVDERGTGGFDALVSYINHGETTQPPNGQTEAE